MSLSVEGLRPWEWWQMDSEEYDMIRELQSVYRSEVKYEQESIRRMASQ